MQITLNASELMTAATAGVRRQIRAIVNGSRHRVELESTKMREFDSHIVGAMAELAVARGLNLYWSGFGDGSDTTDVGSATEGVEVRCRRIGGAGLDLAIRESDVSNKPYVLVHEAIPVFTLVGWLYAREARAAGTPGPGGLLYVPPNKLHDMVELIR